MNLTVESSQAFTDNGSVHGFTLSKGQILIINTHRNTIDLYTKASFPMPISHQKLKHNKSPGPCWIQQSEKDPNLIIFHKLAVYHLINLKARKMTPIVKFYNDKEHLNNILGIQHVKKNLYLIVDSKYRAGKHYSFQIFNIKTRKKLIAFRVPIVFTEGSQLGTVSRLLALEAPDLPVENLEKKWLMYPENVIGMVFFDKAASVEHQSGLCGMLTHSIVRKTPNPQQYIVTQFFYQKKTHLSEVPQTG